MIVNLLSNQGCTRCAKRVEDNDPEWLEYQKTHSKSLDGLMKTGKADKLLSQKNLGCLKSIHEALGTVECFLECIHQVSQASGAISDCAFGRAMQYRDGGDRIRTWRKEHQEEYERLWKMGRIIKYNRARLVPYEGMPLTKRVKIELIPNTQTFKDVTYENDKEEYKESAEDFLWRIHLSIGGTKCQKTCSQHHEERLVKIEQDIEKLTSEDFEIDIMT